MKTAFSFKSSKFLLLVLVSVYLFLPHYSIACSAFSYTSEGKVIAAKSYDWTVGNGVVLTNLPGLRKAIPTGSDEIISWEAKYGSVTFNQYGQFLPNGGINQAGLVVEVLWLEETLYPDPEQQKPINELNWVQYQLDNFTSVEEVLDNLPEWVIVPIFAKLHYFLADASGNSAIIQLLDGKVHVYSGEDLVCSAITNNTYNHSVEYLEFTEQEGRLGGSLNRFTRLAESLDKGATAEHDDYISQTFEILNDVWVSSWTKWNTVYNITDRKIYFKSQDSRSIKSFSLHDFDLQEGAKPVFADINNYFSGDISEDFIPFESKHNFELMLNSIKLTGIPFSEDEIALFAAFPKTKQEVISLMKERNKTHGKLIIQIHNLKKNQGFVRIGVFDSEENMEKQSPTFGGEIRGSADVLTYVFYNVPLNNYYAVGFYHDENANGKLDRNFLRLPKEPYGFSNRSRKFEKAKFFFDESGYTVPLQPR